MRLPGSGSAGLTVSEWMEETAGSAAGSGLLKSFMIKGFRVMMLMSWQLKK